MRTIKQGDDTITCFDSKVFIQEKNLIKFHHDNSDSIAQYVVMYSNLEGSHASPIAKYYLDNNGDVTIDMSDYIRAYPNVSTIYVEDQQCTVISIPMSVIGLSRPIKALIPDTWDGAIIVPPSRILKSISGATNAVEFYLEEDHTINDELVQDVQPESIEVTADRLVIKKNIYTMKVVTTKNLECGHKYCAIRWESSTGVTRCATFEVKENNTQVKDKTQLINLDGFSVLKGKSLSFKAFLTDLDQYDMWYYSDIITSSKVDVLIAGEEWRQVDVTSNSATVPDGNAGEFNTLELSITYKDYDAATM